jgi:hypothetical protein
MKIAFWTLWLVDAVVALIALIFFFIGLGDHTVSSFNIGIWCILLGGIGGVLIGSCVLRAYVHPVLGLLVAAVLAVPAFGALLLLLLVLITHPRMN